MSWRSSNDFRSSNSFGRDPRKDKTTDSSTMRLMIIGGVVLVVIIIGVVIAVNVASRPNTSTVATGTTAVAPVATTAPTIAATTTQPTVAAAATAAGAPAIVSSRATATPAPTVSPADAGPLETTGDAAAGQVLFNSMPNEAIVAGAVLCYTCHNVTPGSTTLVGPSLSGVATRAKTRVPVLSPAQYLRTSIKVPNSYVVEGFTPGTMTQTFAQALTPEQIEDLVAYLLTLEE